jgi:dGTP triphosphohydrolase
MNFKLLLCFVLLLFNCNEEKIETNTSELDKTVRNPMAEIYDITPLADGGAYAMTMSTDGLNQEIWYLRQNVAFLVAENKIPEVTFDSLNTGKEKYLWAQLQLVNKEKSLIQAEVKELQAEVEQLKSE